jgi:peptide/nickel transport system substrate-binding protein
MSAVTPVVTSIRGEHASLRSRRVCTIVRWMSILAISLLATGGAGAGATTRAEAQARAAVPSGGTVTMPIVGDPIFNPWYPGVGVESVFPDRVLFDGLTRPGTHGLPAPDLATRWQVSRDGLTWTFALRHGVTWHDGTAFTSADVVYTFNNVVLNKSLAASGSSYFLAVANVRAQGPYTVIFHLHHPFAALPAYLGYNAGILPKHIFNGKNPFKLTSFNKGKPVGTGPFKMGTYIPDQSVELVANPHYWGGAPHLHRIVFKVLPDPNAQVAQLLSGELNLMIVDVGAATARLKSASNLALRSEYVPQFYWIALNQNNKLFTDVRVRQAIMYALNRQAMIAAVARGYATIANAAISPALRYYYTTDVKKYGYSPAMARKLLAQAGWTAGQGGILRKNGKPFSFVLDVGQKGYLVPIAELVQSYLKAVGIQVKLNVMEWNASIQKDFVQKSYEAVVNWWVYPDDPDVSPFFSSAAANTQENEPGYRDATLDKLLLAGQQATSPAARRAAYAKVQMYMSQQLPYIFLWFPKEVQARSTRLHGIPAVGLRDAMNYTAQWYMTP